MKKNCYSTGGYKSSSPDRFNKTNTIPSGNITMKGVPHPVYGVDDMGNSMMMYPGADYTFPGNTVTEYPIRKEGGNMNVANGDFYEKKKNFFLEWLTKTAANHSKNIPMQQPPMTQGVMQIGGVVNSQAYNIGRVYTSPFDQPISPDIYGDPNFQQRNTIINNADYGRQQAQIDYSTTGVRPAASQPANAMGDFGLTANLSPQPTAMDWLSTVSPSMPNMPVTDPTVGMTRAYEEPIANRGNLIASDQGTATFDRNRPLERDLKKYQRQQRRDSVPGEVKANILLAGMSYINNIAGADDTRRQEEWLRRQQNADVLYNPVAGYRGDYLLNPQGSNFRPDNYTFGNYGKVYADGGGIHIKEENKGKFTEAAHRAGMGVQEFASHVMANKEDYSSTTIKRANFAKNASKFKHETGGQFNAGDELDMTDEEIAQFIANGGQIEYLD